MRNTVLYHSNILSAKEVPFLNSLADELSKSSISLILTGWNPVLVEWNLKVPYYRLPNILNYFRTTYTREEIEDDFSKFNLCVETLLNRFNWWFEKPSNEVDLRQRIAFLHYYLNHYSKLIKLYKPSFILIWNGFDPRHLILSSLADFYGISKIFLERGPLPSLNFFDKSGVLCSSSVFNKKLKITSEDKVLGEKYRKWYRKSNETLWEQPNKKTINIRKKFSVDPSLKITLFVGQIDNDVQTKLFSPYFSSNLEAFSFFIKFLRDKNHFVIGKHHPKSKIGVNFYRELIKGEDNAVWSEELNLEDCLKVADNVVAVNSSVIFDALIYKKPVLALGNTILHGQNVLYEYKPEKNSVVEQFYLEVNLTKKLKNFDLFFEYLLRNNLIFFEEAETVTKFSRYLINSLSEVQITNDNIMKNEIVLQNYINNINFRLYKKELRFMEKFKSDIRWYFKKFKKLDKWIVRYFQ